MTRIRGCDLRLIEGASSILRVPALVDGFLRNLDADQSGHEDDDEELAENGLGLTQYRRGHALWCDVTVASGREGHEAELLEISHILMIGRGVIDEVSGEGSGSD